MRDIGLLSLRLATGGLLMGHGAQKLFGSFGGPGLEGTAAWLESIGMRPGKRWAPMAGGGEFVGGLLTTLGLFNPVGPIMLLGPMTTAIHRAHWGKPIWVTAGGAELPVTNIAVAAALIFAGPGAFSLDHILGIHLSKWKIALFIAATAGGIAAGAMSGRGEQATQPAVEQPSAEQTTDEASKELQGKGHAA